MRFFYSLRREKSLAQAMGSKSEQGKVYGAIQWMGSNEYVSPLAPTFEHVL